MLTKNSRRALALSLGFLLYALYLLAYRGGFHSVDEVSMFAVTESLVKFGQVNTDQIAWTQWTTSQAEAQGFFGPDGHVYSKKGVALSLAQAPLYGLALLLPGLGMLQTVSLLNAFITAATGLLLFMFLERMGFSIITSLLTALIFGLATIAFVYAKYLFSEPLAGFLLLLAAYMLFTYRQEGGARHLVIAGLAAGFAVLTRANNLFLLPIFGLYLLWLSIERPSISKPRDDTSFTIHNSQFTIHYSPFIIFTLTVALTGLLLLAYNALRSGNPLQTGYDLTLFSPNLLLGLYKLLFSPLRGLFIYSPILLLSLPGWWWLRRRFPAEAWLCAGLVGVTLLLFSAWSSGEGLSWGSRFLVPIVPFFALCLAPVVERVAGSKGTNDDTQYTTAPFDTISFLDLLRMRRSTAAPPPSSMDYALTHHASRFTFYALLLISFLIQLLGLAINPWVYLAQLQADFGGEFFLENTPALYDFRYSQIAGQIQTWSLENSDLAWLRWGFDGWAFGLSLGLVLAAVWLLWRSLTAHSSSLLLRAATPLLAVAITYALLIRYNQTDRQFGPPNDAYTQALEAAADQMTATGSIITVAQYHYHLPMNRFKAQVPLIGLAQQGWPLPETALPLLEKAVASENAWLVTVGFPPAAADNATEQWLSLNQFKAGDTWFDDSVRLVRYVTTRPTRTRPIDAIFGDTLRLTEIKLRPSLQAGQGMPVQFTWQPLHQPTANFHLFLQLLNIDGAVIAQQDGPPNGGYSPTTTWQPDQTITTRRALLLPDDLTAGDYRLIVGLYDPATGHRLTTTTGSDFVELGIVSIREEVGSKE